MLLTGINWLVTYNCNAQCRHCFFETRGQKKFMNPDLIDRVLKNFTLPKQMFWQHISGGELMLNPENLYEIIRRIRKYHQKDLGISTNGFWAVSPEKAQVVVRTLKELGVTGIAISADFFHQEFIPIDRPLEAARALVAAGLQTHSYAMETRVKEEINHSEFINRESSKIADLLANELEIPKAPTSIRSIGKGSEINVPKKNGIPSGPCTDLSECLGQRSPFNPAMVWIDTYGNVMVCYGIILGNVHQTPFPAIIENYHSKVNPITERIASRGPIGLYELAKENGLNLPDSYFDTCDLCYQSRSVLREIYPEILGPKECYPV